MQRFFPVLDIVRLKTTSPLLALMPNSERISNVCRFVISKTLSTVAEDSPVRIKLESALPPRIRLRASIIIDFPAPVSPVSAVRPDVNSTFRLSIIAKLFILNSFSIIFRVYQFCIFPKKSKA